MENEKQTYGLSLILSKESLWDWEAEYHSAFDSMELNRIKACLDSKTLTWEKDEVLDYMVAKINEVVWDWETPPKVMEVLKEDLDDWMQRFDLWLEIMDAPSEPLEVGFFLSFGEDWGEQWDTVFDLCPFSQLRWDFTNWPLKNLRILANNLWSSVDAINDDDSCLLSEEEWESGVINTDSFSYGERAKRVAVVYDYAFKGCKPLRD
jgi:hypothetical protein